MRLIVNVAARLRKMRCILPIPLALKSLLGIVFAFEPKELLQLRIAGGNLFGRCPAVISEEERPTELDDAINNLAEVSLSFGDSFIGVLDVQVADDTDRSFPGPGKKSF